MVKQSNRIVGVVVISVLDEHTRESPWWAYRPRCHHTYPAHTVSGRQSGDRLLSSRTTKAVAESDIL